MLDVLSFFVLVFQLLYPILERQNMSTEICIKGKLGKTVSMDPLIIIIIILWLVNFELDLCVQNFIQ